MTANDLHCWKGQEQWEEGLAGARVSLEGDGGFSVIVVMVARCIQRQPQQIVHFKSGQPVVSVLRLNKAV